ILCGLSLLIGMHSLAVQDRQFQESQEYLASEQARWQSKGEEADPGYIGYYLFSPAQFQASPWAGLFPGERREVLSQLRIRLLAVQGQLYGTPMINIAHLHVGWLDLTFVWLYLLPLLIGLISVTCAAEDRSSGRWPLLVSQSLGAQSFVARR